MMHVFDVDGTLIASNAAKAEAFRRTAAAWGDDVADRAVAFHRQAGSISREERWVHIFAEIIGVEPSPEEFAATVATCTRWVDWLCAASPTIPGVEAFVRSCDRRLVVSGIRQPELGRVLDRHGLSDLFPAAFGGRKALLLPELVRSGTIPLPAVYYGDTRDDWLSATAAGLDFVLVTADTEWDWRGEYDGPRLVDFELGVPA